MNDTVTLDLQDKSDHKSSLNKTPVTIIQEYATKYHLVPRYDLIYNSISVNAVSFKYSLTLEDYTTIGEGVSKKEAKQVAAFKLIRQLIEDKPELLKTDFKHWDSEEHAFSPFDNTIKVNAIGQLRDICTNNKLALPEFNLVREEGQAHAKLFTMSCQVAKMIETATHKTKKQAKQLAAIQMVKKLLPIDMPAASESKVQAPDSMKVLERVKNIKIKYHFNDHPHMDEDISDCHLRFKKIKWPKNDTLKEIIEQYKQDNTLEELADPYAVLRKIISEFEVPLFENWFDKESTGEEIVNYYTLGIDTVYPPVFAFAIDKNMEKAKTKASYELLRNICILSM